MKVYSVNFATSNIQRPLTYQSVKTTNHPTSYISIYNTPGISFGHSIDRKRCVPDIEFEEYKTMTETQKNITECAANNFTIK